METITAQFSAAGGWSTPLPPFDGPGTLVLVFAGANGGAGVETGLADVRRQYPRSAVIGCSTAGEILHDLVSDDTVTVAVTRFEDVELTPAAVAVGSVEASRACGAEVGRRLRAADPDLQAVFLLCDGMLVNGSEVIAGLASEVGRDVLITGGLAGDGDRFAASWVLVDGAPVSGYVTAVGLSGPRLEVGHGSRGGWDIFGPERRVTRSKGNVVYELDGQPVLSLYKTYLGDRAAGLPATALLFPLSIREHSADEAPLVRTILAVDEDTQALTFAGDVPEGSLAQLMRANFDRLIDGAHQAATASAGAPAGSLAVAVSCVGRRLVLGPRTEEELEAVLAGLACDSTLVGFYSYGEISPTGGVCALHNQTMTLTTFHEHPAH